MRDRILLRAFLLIRVDNPGYQNVACVPDPHERGVSQFFLSHGSPSIRFLGNPKSHPSSPRTAQEEHSGLEHLVLSRERLRL